MMSHLKMNNNSNKHGQTFTSISVYDISAQQRVELHTLH